MKRGSEPVQLSKRVRQRLVALARRRVERGAALILVLGSLTILTVMLTEFQDQTSGELASALAERDGLKAEYAAKSGINLTRLIIAAEPTIRAQLAPMFLLMKSKPPQIPVWEFADDVLSMFNDANEPNMMSQLAQVDFGQSKNLSLEGARFSVQVVDEDSKINLNTAARGDAFSRERVGAAILGLIGAPQYNELFEKEDAEGQYSTQVDVCSAIVDWADPDVEAYLCDPHSGVAQAAPPEDSFYQLLDDPYPRKNAAYDSLDELHLVRGITDDFWATFIEPDPDDPASRPVTVWGQGKVNVNTANPQTVLGLICANAVENTPVCTDPEQAIKFLSGLALMKQFTSGIPIFSSGKDFVAALQGKGPFGQILAALGVDPIQFRDTDAIDKMVGSESKIFSIVATGYVKELRRETQLKIHAVVDFRGAPDLSKVPLPPSLAAAVGQNGTQGQQGQTQNQNQTQNLPAGATEDALARAFRADPAGKVIYYRFY